MDDQNAALPGVTATLTGDGAPEVQVTDAVGQVRFLGLAPGTYRLSAELEGFSPAEHPNISITNDRNTMVEVILRPAVEENLDVVRESPLVVRR
jgi:hypothetical protein